MKKIYSYAFAASVLMLASCSNESDPVINGGEAGEDQYLAVNICVPNSTRATEGEFEAGNDAENKADNGLFLIFDKLGNQIGEPQSVVLTPWNDAPAGSPEVSKISQAVLVIGSETGGVAQVTGTGLLCILNAPSGAAADLKGKTLDEVMAVSGSYETTGSEGSFVMSNSVYFEDSSNKVVTAAIAGHIEKEPNLAKDNPVDIYVDRVTSKINVGNADGGMVVTKPKVEINGQEVELDVEFGGIEIANRADESYLVKNVNWLSDWTGFNDLANRRTYWANIPSDVTYSNKSWNEYTEGTKYNTAGAAYPFYTQENTNREQTTDVLISATLKLDGKGLSFLYWGGMYWLKEGFLDQIASNVKGQGYRFKGIKDGNVHYMDFTAANFRWITDEEHAEADGIAEGTPVKDLERYETYTQYDATTAPTGYTIVNSKDETVTADDVNEFLKKESNQVQLWEGGRCYYYVPIEHFGLKDKYDMGVVRNHIYELTLESLTGLGTPVYSPGEEIIPQKREEDSFYVAARINILKWKIVKQGVQFKD